MKKAILFIFIFAMMFAVSCGGNEEPTPEPTEAVAEVIPTETNTAVPEPTATEILPTNTAVSEPPTATPLTTVSDEEATKEPTAEATTEEATETAVPESTPTEEAATEATATSDDTGEEEATATSPPVSNPPPSTNVEAPPDNNYPEYGDKAGWENRIRVPAGFSVKYIGRVDGQPTSITFGPDGLLYIAVQLGTIYTMDDNGGVGVYASGFNTPTGIAFRPGTSDLYVSSRIRNENVGGEAQVSIANGRQIIGGIPCCYTFFHSANGIAFGSDGMGYVGIGARADHGEKLDGSGQQDELHPMEASIIRFNPDTGDWSSFARGTRNPYDIAWDANGQLWATDNMPDFDPPEVLHRIQPGAEHGYPWYDCDVCFSPPAGVTINQPRITFVPSSSPTGITAYLSDQFPGYYNSLFLTLWSAFPGAQKVMLVGAGGTAPTNFATGFGAPIDVTVGPDGSLYVADWATGIIFKISYTG